MREIEKLGETETSLNRAKPARTEARYLNARTTSRSPLATHGRTTSHLSVRSVQCLLESHLTGCKQTVGALADRYNRGLQNYPEISLIAAYSVNVHWLLCHPSFRRFVRIRLKP